MGYTEVARFEPVVDILGQFEDELLFNSQTLTALVFRQRNPSAQKRASRFQKWTAARMPHTIRHRVEDRPAR
ncbi:hypothetical protein CEXT_728581 [Caerostris extrusa]|uniref:Uncharacterized protein n=1 Tax=Caerostris extrusa TaxID=172846 RepID=A0AAV4NGE2_CAEEX|nr:hypothetical protein CEXT_728581 [Caerostris extrusa]